MGAYSGSFALKVGAACPMPCVLFGRRMSILPNDLDFVVDNKSVFFSIF